jgi:hypothetical protein
MAEGKRRRPPRAAIVAVRIFLMIVSPTASKGFDLIAVMELAG